MTKNLLLLIAILWSVCYAHGQNMPIISSEDSSNEVWYTIRFLNGHGGVVQDMGNDVTLRAQLPTGNDDQLWKVVQAKDVSNNPISGQYIIVGKSGRKINVNGDRFTASSSASVNITLDTQASDYYGTEMIIRRPGKSGMHQLNSSNPGAELAEWGNFEWASVLIFGPPVPKVSTNLFEAWHYMQFENGASNGNKVITYNGDNINLSQEAYAAGNENQLWKVIGTGTVGEYVIENKSGARLTVRNDRYQATLSGSICNFNFNANSFGVDWWALKNKNAATWKSWMSTTTGPESVEICDGEQHGKASALKFVFVSEEFIPAVLPAFSTEKIEAWHYMQFYPGTNHDNRVVTYNGDDGNLKQRTYAEGDPNQLWKVVKTDKKGDYILENKNGAKVTFVGDRYKASETGEACTFNINYTQFNADYLAMKRKDAIGENQWMHTIWSGNPAVPEEVGENRQHEEGSAMKFVFVSSNLLPAALPTISTDDKEVWYYMQFYPGTEYDNRVVTYSGEDENLRQKTYGNNDPHQLWKIVKSTEDGDYILINKAGAKLTFANERYQASKEGEACILNFNPTNYNPDYLAMKRKDATGEYQWMHAMWSGSPSVPDEIGEYSQHEAGSAVKFVYVSENTTNTGTNEQISFIWESGNIVSHTIQIQATSGKSYTIDWGDGYHNTFTANESAEEKRHGYSGANQRHFVTITADDSDCHFISLNINNNGVSLLDVSNAPELKKLMCAGNQLSSLDVSKNIALTHLYCYENLLSNLDVSKNISLTTLLCQYNQLQNLNINNNSALESLSCYSNYFKFSGLPISLPKSGTYTYAPQNVIVVEVSEAGVVNLSGEYSINGNITSYTWYEVNSSIETKLLSGFTEESGIFTFDDTYKGKTLHCKMTNGTFPDFTANPLVYEVLGSGSTSVKTLTNQSDIKVYFVSDGQSLEVNSDENQIDYIDIFALSGQSIYRTQKVNGIHYSISASGWSKGIYLVRVITSEGNSFTTKVMKK